MANPLIDALLRLPLRAESVSSEHLQKTFVDVGRLFTLLSSPDHQVIYGRRGTGKTHCLQYLAEKVRGEGSLAITVDMRTIGSSGGLLVDESLPLAERATRLLADTLGVIHAGIYSFRVQQAEGDPPDAPFLEAMDRLADAVTQVRVIGSVERELSAEDRALESRASGWDAAAADARVTLTARSNRSTEKEAVKSRRFQESGMLRHSIHFGAVGSLLQTLVRALPNQRLWILIDEWSVIPLDLQPLLADWVRRCLFPLEGVTVKIASIERRSSFSMHDNVGGYVGIELGADTSANLDLDDFLVFGNDEEQARRFFAELLFRHVAAVLGSKHGDPSPPASAEEFVRCLFDEPHQSFREFTRAAEGVPRDAINIAGLCGQLTTAEAISVTTVRRAARRWYTRDKEATLTHPDARRLLHWIVDKVLREKRGAVFLLEERVASDNQLIELLYDARVLHVLKKGVAATNRIGERFDVYGLDYGCFVDFLAHAEEPATPLENGIERVTVEEISLDQYEPRPETILDLSEFPPI